MDLRHLKAACAAALLAGCLAGAARAQEPSDEPQQLQQLDAWSVGALSRSQGALDPTLWATTDATFLSGLFDRLPATYESPAAQALARRVLLSGGAAPDGDAQAGARKRFEALTKMGLADELATMAVGSGAAVQDPTIAQYAAQAELARGRRVEACARGRNAISDPPAPFILRLRAYCAAAVGDRAAADLALALIHTSTPDDTWFSSAVAATAGAQGARPPTARFDNSLTAQLSIAAQFRPGPNPLNNASNLALVTIARAENAPQPVRAQAAALAFRRGILSAADARAVLHATPAEITSGLPPIAAVLRQVEASPGSLDAAAAIAGVLRQAAAPADFYAASVFFRPDIATLQTAPDPGSTLLFARAAIVTGDVALSQRLVGIARSANVDQSALAPLDAALAALMSMSGQIDPQAPQRRVDAAGAALARGAARDVAILSAIGFPIDGAMETFLTANPPQGGVRPDPALLMAIDAAVERHAVGQTGLLAVVAMGDGPARLETQSLCSILRDLRAVGLERDARRLALEALLAGAPATPTPAPTQPAQPPRR